MAYIYKRGLKWAYRAYAGKDPVTGKDKQASKSGFLTKKDAQLAAALFERQFHNGEYVQTSVVTFEGLCMEWLLHYRAQGIKISSYETRKKGLNHLILKTGNIPIQKITKKVYQEAIDSLAMRYSLNTLIIIHSSANMAFNYAHEHKMIKENPSKGVKLPQKRKTVSELESEHLEDNFFEKKELETFLKTAKSEDLDCELVLFSTLAHTGIRIGELLALKWTDINVSKKTFRVSKTYYNPTHKKDAFELLTPKTESSARTISIDSALINLLEAHRLEQDKLKDMNAPFYVDEGFIFAGSEGYPKTMNVIANRMHRLLSRSGINRRLTPHSMRHTHTALLIEANVHIKEIQERLGHSNINTTFSIYAHLTKDVKKEASNKFSDLMKDLSNDLIL